MALSRNQRRKVAKARFNKRVLGQTKAKVARQRQAVKDTVAHNLNTKVERNYYPESSMAAISVHYSGTVHVGRNDKPRPIYALDDAGRWR